MYLPPSHTVCFADISDSIVSQAVGKVTLGISCFHNSHLQFSDAYSRKVRNASFTVVTDFKILCKKSIFQPICIYFKALIKWC